MSKPVKHVPKHMKLPLFKNRKMRYWRLLRERELLNKGYTIL